MDNVFDLAGAVTMTRSAQESGAKSALEIAANRPNGRNFSTL
jgi:hypothetical protein